MSLEAPNGNGKISLQTLAMVVSLAFAGWTMFTMSSAKDKEIADLKSTQQKEILQLHKEYRDKASESQFILIKELEMRQVKAKEDLDTALQREMRTLLEVVSKSVEGNDRLSLDRHNFQERELGEIKEQLKDFRRK